MPKLTKEIIQTLTELCRIGCPEEEQEAFLENLNRIVAYVEQLQELDTEGITPCNHVIEGMVNVMREDQAGETLSRKEFLENAPDQIGGLVRVPTIISKR